MAGTGKLSRLSKKYKVINIPSNVNIDWTYHITEAVTITLPNTASLSIGDKVTFTKAFNIVPTIQRFGSTVTIKTRRGSDSSVLFDIDAEVIFVWNGTEWEV